MPKLVWNGGFELDWKTIGAVLGFVFLSGGGWYKLDETAKAFREQAAVVKLQESTILLLGYRIDGCCPQFNGIKPKDMVPPGSPR